MRGPQLAQEYEAYRFSPLAGIKFAERPDNFLVIRSVDFGFSPLAGIKFAESGSDFGLTRVTVSVSVPLRGLSSPKVRHLKP